MKLTPFLLAFLIAVPVFGQDTPVPEPVTSDVEEIALPLEVEEAAPIDEPKIELKVDGDKVTVGEVITDIGEVSEAVVAYRAAKKAGTTGKEMILVWMAILMAVFKFLLSAVKFSGPFWKGRRGKTVLRLTTVTLGLLVFLTTKWAMGMGWMDAVILGLSGPLAAAFHEYTILIPFLAKKKDKEAASG